MVLEDLGASLTKALSNMASKTVIDDDALGELLKDIQRALLLADVNVQLVRPSGASSLHDRTQSRFILVSPPRTPFRCSCGWDC